MELRHIRYFLAVAEDLSFRRAAERLSIAQPAISRSVKSLEDDIGVTLFDRDNRNVRLTDAGKVFREGSMDALSAIERTVEKTRQASEGHAGALRIGYTDSAITGIMPSLLKAFQDRWPDISLQPMHDYTGGQLSKLDKGDLDIGFVTGPIRKTGYGQVPVHSEKFVCVVYADHPLAGRPSIRVEELAEENFVHGPPNEWAHFYAYLIPMCQRFGFVPKIVQEAYNTAGILGLVASGMGITILGERATVAVSPGLSVIPLEDVAIELQTIAIWKSKDQSNTMKRFVEFLRET